MGTAKLMTPLFYDGNYNVEKKRMRAVLEREVSNGAVSYRLWRSDGKPDLEYPRAANDAYILHVEVNDHLVPLRMTDYALVNHCGLLPATVALYGSKDWTGAGNVEKLNEKYFPCGHWRIVHTVLMSVARSLFLWVGPYNAFCDFAIKNIACNEASQTYKKGIHRECV